MQFLSNNQSLSDNLITQNLLAASIFSGLCLVVGGHFYYKNKFSFWSKRGIPGPKPWPLVGNIVTWVRSNRTKLDLEWSKTYGRVFGVYEGSTPRLWIVDPDLVQRICIKDFDIWHDHEVNPFLNKYQKNFIFLIEGNHWKEVRAIMSPTFTSGKIKRMFKFLDFCADDLVEIMAEQIREQQDKNGDKFEPAKGAIINAKELHGLYTTDAIATCCYGLKLERAGEGNDFPAGRNEFNRMAQSIFRFPLFRFFLANIAPTKLLHAIGFTVLPLSFFREIASFTTEIVQRRQKSAKKFDDYLQILLEARLGDELELDELDASENHHVGVTKESLLKDQEKILEQVRARNNSKTQLSDLEVLSGAMFLLIVGVETTANLLTSASIVFANHPDIEQRLYEEISAIAEPQQDKKTYHFEYEKLTQCVYLDAFLSECLRRFPPVMQVDRISNADYRIDEYDLDLPAGSKIFLGVYALHHDPELWEDPMTFNPERFMPENRHKIKSGSYLPFGMGPRHCIGMRFSLTEAKLAVAKLIMHYKFKPAPGGIYPPEPKNSLGLFSMSDPRVRIVPRV